MTILECGLSTNLLHIFEDLKRIDIFLQKKVLGCWGVGALGEKPFMIPKFFAPLPQYPSTPLP